MYSTYTKNHRDLMLEVDRLMAIAREANIRLKSIVVKSQRMRMIR